MRVYTFGENQRYESADNFDPDYSLEYFEGNTRAMMGCFTKRRLFREILAIHGQRNNLKGMILFHAHGKTQDNKWIFGDGRRRHSVQNWINKKDGEALAILLQCCNEDDNKIYSAKSVIIHPRTSIGVPEITRGGCLRIYVPGEGYLDTHHQLRKAIDKLKE